MTSRLNPYIAFAGTARQAMEFYQTIFGGELRVSTFGEFPGADAATADQVMHAQLETDLGFTLMASDTPPGMEHKVGDNITISLSGDDNAALHGYWDALAQDGTVSMPLEKQMWGDEFGMLTDKFGIPWMVNVSAAQS